VVLTCFHHLEKYESMGKWKKTGLKHLKPPTILRMFGAKSLGEPEPP
jgi:hypothetical protein